MSGTRNNPAMPRIGGPTPEFSDEVVRRARLLQLRGYKMSDVQELLADEGHFVPFTTLEGWLKGNTRRFAGWPTGRTITA